MSGVEGHSAVLDQVCSQRDAGPSISRSSLLMYSVARALGMSPPSVFAMLFTALPEARFTNGRPLGRGRRLTGDA